MLSLRTIIHLWMTMFILMGIDSLTPGLGVLTFGWLIISYLWYLICLEIERV